VCDSNHRIGRSAFILMIVVLTCGIPVQAQEQGSPPQNLELAQKFLQIMYPGLRGQHYDLTTTVYSSLDAPLRPMRRLVMQVGEGPPGTIFGYRGQGHIVGYDPPADSQPGPIYAKQFLIANFMFDKNERLSSFAAGGPEAERPEGDQVAMNLRELSPEFTDAQADTELKKAGAMYVSTEKEKFLKALPLVELEKLFGKITVVSTQLKLLRDGDPGPTGHAQWLVAIRVKQTDGTQLTYKMIFEPFKAALTNMDAVSP
jgi:hypothetical protein